LQLSGGATLVRIWHLDTVGSAEAVDGVATGLWVLARAQAALGHDVVLFVRTEPAPASRAQAAQAGIQLVRMDRSPRAPSLALVPFRKRGLPDVYHFHGAWMPYHAVMSTWLRLRKRPYVVTTHGGYGPEVLESKRLRRSAYVTLFEAPHLRGAGAAITTVAGEDRLVHDIAGPRCRVVQVPWPADTSAPTEEWRPDFDHPTAVFLGRFEVHQKGLDRLAEIASLCPDIVFALYGHAPAEGSAVLSQLVATMPANVHFHGPVHGQDKKDVLRHATVYLQPSRFEGFSLSVVDALLAGLPVVASEHLGLTHELAEHAAGGALPTDIPAAARYLRQVVADRDQLTAWSRSGPPFARARFDPSSSAAAHVAVYDDVISRRRRRDR
jgi:glycosyltransferase involved in cell wall biosynthesis